MADLTYGQLEQLWISAGGSKALAPLMAAIALAESSGNPGATNPTDNNGTQTSWGLWQISDGTHNQPAPDILTPLGNAKAAVAKYEQQGLSAWGTYDSGAYKQYYRGSVPPSQIPAIVSTGGGGATTDAWWSSIPGAGLLGGASTAVTDISHALEWFFKPGNIARIIAFFFGLLLGIPGLIALLRVGGGSGDISLALGILLVTLSGACFFIAFHNLPTDISSIGELLAWISASIREGKPAAGTEAIIPDNGLGARVGKVAGGAV